MQALCATRNRYFTDDSAPSGDDVQPGQKGVDVRPDAHACVVHLCVVEASEEVRHEEELEACGDGAGGGECKADLGCLPVYMRCEK